jgi:ATPase subunit of ABC transporter with duplicated ATPase domains
MDLSVKNITKSFSIFDILDGVSFHVNTGEKVGIVGPNGCGKTTLFKIIMGTEKQDEGEIFIRKSAQVGYLDQIPEYDNTVREVLWQAFEAILKEQKKLQELEQLLIANPMDEAILKRYGMMQEQFESIGGYEIETEFNKIVRGLNIPDVLLDRDFTLLSGGEKSRVILGKILLEQPDILLLDEPTNHLDLDSIAWLEGYLAKYKGSVLIISHDRYLLEKTVTKIINIEQGKARVYKGSYSYYVKEKALYMDQLWKNYKAQERKIKKMEDQIERYRIWGKMRDSDKMYRRAKELEKRLDRLEKVDRPFEQRTLKFNFDDKGRTGNEVIKVENYSKSFDEPLLNDVNFTVRYGDKAFLIGKNGTGKTTLFKSILGTTDYEGEVKVTGRAKIGNLSQEIHYQNNNLSIVNEFRRVHNCGEGEARQKLAKFLFYGDEVVKAVGDISGGEKSRLELCKMVNSDANVLLLDEPTNHLDFDSKEMLEETLLEYPGTMLIISHDRYFINKLSDYILVLEDMTVNRHDGDYDQYFNKKQEKVAKPKKVRVKPTKERNFEKELEVLEKKIQEIEKRMAEELKQDVPSYSKFDEWNAEKEQLEAEYLEVIEAMQ